MLLEHFNHCALCERGVQRASDACGYSAERLGGDDRTASIFDLYDLWARGGDKIKGLSIIARRCDIYFAQVHAVQ